MKKIISRIISLPKTLFINLKCFNFFDAIKLPILVKYDVKIRGLNKKTFKYNGPIKYGAIKFGYGGSEYVSAGKSIIDIRKGRIIVNGYCHLSTGCSIFINNGTVIVGNNFYANRNLMIQSENTIYFDDDVLIGWNVSIRDTDGHEIIYKEKNKNTNYDVIIGKHVWIASDAIILKKTKINKNSVIGCRAFVSGYSSTNNGELIAGVPAKCIKKIINWKE